MSTQVRSWKGNDGKFAVEASFSGLFQKTKVKLIKSNGAMVAVALDRLCQEDQDYVNELLGLSNSPPSKPAMENTPRSQHPPQPQPQPERNTGHTPQHDKSTILAYARLENKTSPGLASFLREAVAGKSPEKQKKPAPLLKFPPDSDANLVAAVDRLATSPRSPRSLRLPLSPTFSSSKSLSKTTTKSATSSISSSEAKSYAPMPNPNFRKRSSGKQPPLLTLPQHILTQICVNLDIRSIIYLTARVSKAMTALLDNPQAKAYGIITFHPDYHYLIDHRYVLALASYLKRHNTLHTVHTIIYDSTKVQELTVMYTLEHFSGLQHMSLQKCWDVHSYPLANLLARRNATRGTDRIRLPHLRSIEFGKTLRRGDVPAGFLIVRSESYGQDIGLIGLALRGLAGHDVKFDTYLCGTCDRGAAKPIFDCSFCGPVATKKCWDCAPKCESINSIPPTDVAVARKYTQYATNLVAQAIGQDQFAENATLIIMNDVPPMTAGSFEVTSAPDVDCCHAQGMTLFSVLEAVEPNGVSRENARTKAASTSACVEVAEVFVDGAVQHARSAVDTTSVESAFVDMLQSAADSRKNYPNINKSLVIIYFSLYKL